MVEGRVVQVNVSPGGVPKLPVPAARVTSTGVEGDRQRETTVHGGPHRAVSLLGMGAIRRVAAEGHPIAPGTTGENLTVDGFDVSALPVGTRLAIGDELVLELSGTADPCRTIRHSFRDLRFGRLSAAAHPRDSRMYARVVHEGTVRPGDTIALSPPPSDGAAARQALAARIDRAERASALALWRAAAGAGHRIAIVDDGELAIGAAPTLPGPIFNLALGFTGLPNLVDRAVGHFRVQGVTGWVWTDDEPWPGAMLDSTAVYGAGAVADTVTVEAPDGISIRELGRTEVGPWAETIAVGAPLPKPVAAAWRALEPELARASHHHRFVAEVDGRSVAAGSLHTHHGVGWLRAGVVLPAWRGRGIQRALIAARTAHAARLGCDLVGASADAGGVSARNIETAGLQTVAVRGRYRVPAA